MQGLDLDTVLNSSEHVYVKNNLKPKGQFILTLSDPNTGATKVFKVPKTWIPIKVTGAVPKEILRHSMDFRAALENQTIVLMPAKEAEKILVQADAQEEWNRLRASSFSHDKAFHSQAAQDMMKSMDQAKEATASHEAAKLNIEDEHSQLEKINPAVIALVTRVNDHGLGAKEALNELRCIEDDLKADDTAYLVSNCEGNIRQWAKDKLSSLMEAKG